ncbi:hypothetical protein BN59_03341 [Legionella massiliensis]|uniref:Uncharacterized protein n=1 Tax=Legionella massiliensis TaxID=1034943 RepID=A0A078KXA1_9GAMM|nr:hypothetical protein [Legionella massiliensis]CDZ79025.1 hypothetical protein BN59_03341 [Legionella massiliensis]CEE14763.1 hypothetical protein BN1094_03341 [Legionella massiliensis]
MGVLIGPNEQNGDNAYLDSCGREYGNYKMVNNSRSRILEGVPAEKIKQFSLDYDEELYEGNSGKTQTVDFCVVQQDDDNVPVFLLPATQDITSKMDSRARKEYMNNIFNQCYLKYRNHCLANHVTPVEKKYCAATVVAGTKTMWGGDHFTAMIKPPGDEDWQHVDPTSFGGPQKFNRYQCGGYSSMIEAEALMHYSSMSINSVIQEENQNSVLRSFLQFIDKLAFKFNTWFSAERNEVILNPKMAPVQRGQFETTYAEMADFSAGRLARVFDNQEFIKTRVNGNLEDMVKEDGEVVEISSKRDEDIIDEFDDLDSSNTLG